MPISRQDQDTDTGKDGDHRQFDTSAGGQVPARGSASSATCFVRSYATRCHYALHGQGAHLTSPPCGVPSLYPCIYMLALHLNLAWPRLKFYNDMKPSLLVAQSKALFSSKNFWKIDNVALSFVFDKYYPIID